MSTETPTPRPGRWVRPAALSTLLAAVTVWLLLAGDTIAGGILLFATMINVAVEAAPSDRQGLSSTRMVARMVGYGAGAGVLVFAVTLAISAMFL